MSPERPRSRGIVSLPPRVGDIALTVFVTVFSIGAGIAPREDNGGAPEVSIILLAVLASVPVIARRRFPLQVALIVEAATAVHLIAVNSPPAAFALVVAIYSVALYCDRRTSLRMALATGGINSVLVLLVTLITGREIVHNLVFVIVLAAGAWALGDNVRTRRAYLASLEERAARLEGEREERDRRAVLDERARIARELHDVVAHHVSAIAVQAGAAEEAALENPQRAREALGFIQGLSREALSEMRALVGVLATGDDAAALAPQPGLDQVERLVDQVRAAGVAVDLTVEGTRRRLPETLDVTAYRIVQEALTNTLKHAGSARATVTVRFSDDTLELDVSDDGRGARPRATVADGGRGLMGMRERVALFHGRLSAGPVDGGGFRVHAWLPTGGLAS
jgi:signal transduction histidine kinase